MYIFLLFESREDWIKHNTHLKNSKSLSRFLANHREIRSIEKYLSDSGFKVELLDYHKLSMEEIFSKITDNKEAIFWNLTDGYDYFIGSHLPSFLHLIQKPYIGSSTFVQTLCQNKHLLKEVISGKNIKTAKWAYVSKLVDLDFEEIKKLQTPLFIKPAKFDNSIGTELINPISISYKDTIEKINILLDNGIDDILVEEAVLGKEITVACIHTDKWYILPLEQKYNGKYISSYAKENDEGYIRKQQQVVNEELITLTKNVIKVLNLKDYCRIDYRYDDKNNTPYLLEVNSGTFLTSLSFTNMSKLFFQNSTDMFKQLIEFSYTRQTKLL